MSVECRSPHQASIDTIFGAVEKLLAQLQAEGYQTETVGLMEVAPVHLSEKVTAALSQGLRENKLPLKTLPSGAGHDSMFISQVTDVGMLLLPARMAAATARKSLPPPAILPSAATWHIPP